MLRRALLGIVVGGASAVFALPATPAAAATFTAVADSYVDASTPTTNYGNKLYVKVDGSPVLRAYLRFTVSPLVAGGSRLRVFAETASTGGVSLYRVADNTWTEQGVNFSNAPALGTVIASTASFAAGTWLTFDVSSVVTAAGTYNFAIAATGPTAIKFTSRQGTNKPQIVNPPGASPSPYTVTKLPNGPNYRATGANGTTFTGTAKFVVQSAVADLSATGGKVSFAAGVFDLGAEFFELHGIRNIEFAGAGTTLTTIQNNNSTAGDTEPFNFSTATNVIIRNLTVSAQGAARTTSDAIDFDNGSDNLVENVRITASRGRGIVFDGKNSTWNAVRNTVRNCTITGVPSDGIELLASSNNRIEGCTITNVGGHGIQVNKSSTVADQPNKKSSDNVITNNRIDNSGQDGINLHGGDRNQFTNNNVTNSANVTAAKDGIRVGSGDNITCDDNVVSGNTSTDNQTTKTQRYGLFIATPLCNRTVVGPGNNFTGNLTADVRDSGTATIFR